MTSPITQHRDSPWPHRLAVLMACATFPLIWIGSLVTTYDAGMAVPDWPTTFGYNLFAYPWQTWLFGPFDLFIEHGHRLFGALVGLIAIGFVVATHLGRQRRSWRIAAWVALAGVSAQGILGGARVLLDERQLALVHACVGPAFFGYAIVLAVITSRFWTRIPTIESRQARRLARLSSLTVAFVYLQLLFGALVRHHTVTATPGTFRVAVLFHLFGALLVVVHVGSLSLAILRNREAAPWLRWPAWLLVGLVALQLVLGLGTWVVKFGWPSFLADFQFAAGYTVHAQTIWQGWIVSSHVALGSLILAVAVTLCSCSLRLARVPAAALGSGALLMEWAT